MHNLDINESKADIVLTQDLNNDYIQKQLGLGYLLQISFMAAKPRTSLFKYVIDCVSYDVLSHNYGRNGLDVTGPAAFARHVTNFLGVDQLEYGKHDYKSVVDHNVVSIDLAFQEICPNSATLCDGFARSIVRWRDMSDIVLKPKCCENHYNSIQAANKSSHHSTLYYAKQEFKDSLLVRDLDSLDIISFG